MTQQELADKIGYEVKAINRIINGRATITAKMAVALEEVFGAPAKFWMKSQAAVGIFAARKARASEVATEAVPV